MSTSNDVSPPSASAGGAPPPGFPLLSPPPIPGIEQLKQDLTASLDYLVAWTAIMIWDVISMFPSEFRLVWKSDWNYVKIVFLLNRYGSLVLQIMNMSLIVAAVPEKFCSRLYWLTPLVETYVMTVCGAIFALHVWNLYDRDRCTTAIVLGMMGFLIATMSSTATQVTHIVLAPDAQEYLGFYGCLAARRPGGSNVPAILFWTAPFVFNLVMLALATRHSIVASRATESAVTQAFLRDGIWYLSVATVANLVSVLLSAQTVNSNLHTFNAPGSIGLSSVMASRLMLSTLARQAAPRHPFLHNSSHGSRDGGATTRYVPPISSGRATVAHDESAIDHLPHLNDHARRQIRQRALDRDWEEQLDPADEKVDRVSQDVASGLGSTCGVAMECQMSDATLADNRSLRSHGTYENSIKSMPEAEESGREHA